GRARARRRPLLPEAQEVQRRHRSVPHHPRTLSAVQPDDPGAVRHRDLSPGGRKPAGGRGVLRPAVPGPARRQARRQGEGDALRLRSDAAEGSAQGAQRMSASRRPLTVIVPTFNEESTLRDCLESVRFADEILVVDSYSSDSTVSIARELGARVLQHEYVYSARQKNWSIPQATHEWVLLVDSDERVTPELRDEILALLATGPRHDGYWILRANHFLGRRIRHCGWGTDKVIRLFR